MIHKKKILAILVTSCLPFSAVCHATCAAYAPYHEMTVNMSGSNPMNLVTVSQQTGIKYFNLAFIIDAGKCSPAWDGVYTVASAWGQPLTTQMRAAGIQYNVSFGGAGGNDISANCSATQLAAAYQQVINTYQPTGLDFDIENGTAKVANIISALKTVHTQNPNVKISFTLPVMPDGLQSDGKSVVSQAKTAGLPFTVNVMTMDYGSSYSADMGQYATQALTSTFNYLKTLYPSNSSAQVWAMVSNTPMLGVNDSTNEIFTLADATTVTNFSNQNSTAWIGSWSLDRDHPCSGSSPKDTCSSGNVQTKDYQFASNFLACGSVTPPPPPPPPSSTCQPPANVSYTIASSKKAITFTWKAPSNSAPVTSYQVTDYQNSPLWTGTALTYTDKTIPGKGVYEYQLYSICNGTSSSAVEETVKVR